MQHAMLTVHTSNQAALRFYERLGYTHAPHSPNLEDPEEAQACKWRARARAPVVLSL